jgi:hypothetical protein
MYNNSNEMVRGYFMRQSEGGYAPKNFKYNQKNNKNKNKSSQVSFPFKAGFLFEKVSAQMPQLKIFIKY